MEYYLSKKDEVFKALSSDENGLSTKEAQLRLQRYGMNLLKEKKGVSALQTLLDQFKSPLILILIGAVIVSVLLNEMVDSIVIAAILVLNAVFGFFQEYKANKAIEALKKLTKLRALVLRDGRTVAVDAEEIVPGDILVLGEGSSLAADARLIEARNLETMEAPLTGESTPVRKNDSQLKKKAGIADQSNMVFSGTSVTKGVGRAVVVSTGMKTEIGRIASMLEEEEDTETPLQKKLKELGRWFGAVTIAICLIIFGIGILNGNDPTRQFMTAVSLAVAAIPEGLPAVVTIALALGIRRMIKRNALIRNLPSVETLGCTTVICTDKTGTITHNKMTVKKLYVDGIVIDVSGDGYSTNGEFTGKAKDLDLLLKIGYLCNNASLDPVTGDPTEIALLVSAKKAGIDTKEKRTDEVPFDSERKMMTTVHGRIAYTKGAPDVILHRCTKIIENGRISKLDQRKRKQILGKVSGFGQDALRVLGFAYKEVKSKVTEDDLIFVGLQAMIDPPREDVIEEINRCKEAGIRIVMITGDHIETAVAIAKQVGIVGKAVTGEELEGIDLHRAVDEIGVYARVNPEHKMRIVDALQKKKHVVAMSGDGVNDAPALKKAEIGICVGSGTDVAKEASDMILTDDNFVSIVNAVEEGRGIFDNIKKFVNYLLSSNFGEVLVVFIGSLLFRVSPINAVQILWVNLVTDGLPATALGVDPIAKDVMKRKPRKTSEHIVSENMTLNIVIIGIMMCVAALVLFSAGLRESIVKASTMAFTTLVVLELVRIEMIREHYSVGRFSNKWLIGAVVLSLALQLAVIYTPLNKVFKVVALGIADWAWIIGAAAVMFVVGTFTNKFIIRVTREED